MAEASHALHEADMIRDQFLDTRLRADHAAAELSVRAEVANLDQQLARQNLDVLMVQLNTGSGNLSGLQMTPKDEQTARISERDKYIAVINATFEAQQAQVNLLRSTGQLENWLAPSAKAQPVTSPQTP